MRRIRVLYFVSSFEQGGAERQVAELVRNLPRDRFEAHLAVCNTTDDLGYALPVASHVDLRSPRGPDASTFFALLERVRALRPDVVHAYHDPQNTMARLAVRAARSGGAVGSLRCTRLSRRTLRRERWTHRLGDALVVNSSAIRAELVGAGIARTRIDVVENGVDGARFAPLDVESRKHERSRFAMQGITFVVPARVARQKNQLAVIRAVAALRRRGVWPESARVVFAGRVEAHTRYVALVDAATRFYGLSDVIRRIEPVRDVERLLAASDCVLLPSRFEGLPNVVLEGLACGIPAIVSPAANADAIVEDGCTGFVMDDPSARALARSMTRFFETDVNERRAMGVRGRVATLARFGIARMVDATCSIYERVASSRKVDP